MIRKVVFTLCVFALCFGFAAAEEIKGKITKIDEKGVTVLVKNSTDKDGKTYSYAKDCKFSQKNVDAKEEIKDGAKAEVFKNLPVKGINATITTNDKNEVTEVYVTANKKATS